MELGLKGAKVIVTAGAAGIGRAILERFLAEGAQVATCDIDPDALTPREALERLYALKRLAAG